MLQAIDAMILGRVLAVLLLLVSGAVAGERQKALGTSLTMVPPAGFVPSAKGGGFVNYTIAGSIVVMEFPVEASGMLKEVFSSVERLNATFKRGGVVISSLEEIALESGEVVPLARGTQTDANGVVDKWSALYEGPSPAVITLQAPVGRALAPSVVRQFFGSVSFDSPPSERDRIAALPFTIAPKKPFRFAPGWTGHSVLLTASPIGVDPEPHPFLLVFYEEGRIVHGNLDAVAERRLKITSSFANAKIESRKPGEFADAAGIVFEGTTVLPNGDEKYFIQYFGRAQNQHSVRMVVAGEKGQIEALRNTIDEIASSIEFK